MSPLDDLIAQCVAAPDSDAPRLVWADAVARPFDMHPAGLLPSLRELSVGIWCDPSSVAAIARAFGPQLDTLHWTGGIPSDPIKASQALLVAGDPSIAAHVEGEFVIGLRPPWARRPLLYGDDLRSPWFDGGVRG